MTLKFVYLSLYYLSMVSTLVPVTVSLFRIKAFNIQLKALFFYVVLSFITEVISYGFVLKGINNCVVANTFTILEFFCIFLIFYIELKAGKRKYLFLAITAVFLFFAVYKFSLEDPNIIASSIEAIVMMVLSIVYFYRVFVDMNIPKLTRYYFFWLNSAFLIYFTTVFLLLIFEAKIRESHDENFNYLWAIQLSLNIIYNILLSIGIWKTKQI